MKKIIVVLSTFTLLLTGCASHQDKRQRSSHHVPPDNKLLLLIGQDSDTISNYLSQVQEDNVEGVTLYTQLKSPVPDDTLHGIRQASSWDAGTTDFDRTLSEVPHAALAIGLALDTCNQVNHPARLANGDYDDSLATLIDYLVSLAPRKVFLRIGYEFDGPWNCYEPEAYKAAFRYIARALDNADTAHVATVWQSAVWPDGYDQTKYDVAAPNHFSSWYPGDDVVDFVGISVFYRDLSLWNYQPPSNPAEGQEAALSFARTHQKPIMIAESAPQGYRTGALTKSPIHQNKPQPLSAMEIWHNWYAPYFEFIRRNRDIIKVVAYINTHWDAQGMWQCNENAAAGRDGCPQGNWGDSRVQANPYIKAKWLEQVNDTSLWIQTSEYD